MFGGFSGTYLTVDGSVAQTQTYQAPPPKPSKGTLPKGTEQLKFHFKLVILEKQRKNN